MPDLIQNKNSRISTPRHRRNALPRFTLVLFRTNHTPIMKYFIYFLIQFLQEWIHSECICCEFLHLMTVERYNGWVQHASLSHSLVHSPVVKIQLLLLWWKRFCDILIVNTYLYIYFIKDTFHVKNVLIAVFGTVLACNGTKVLSIDVQPSSCYFNAKSIV